MNTLALKKIFYEINFKNGRFLTVALEKKVSRLDLMTKPTVVEMDSVTIDTSSISYAKELDIYKDVSDTAMAYAQTLVGAIKVVAVERVRSYEAINWKMPIKKLTDWIDSFRNNRREWDNPKDDRKKYVDIYRANWWE